VMKQRCFESCKVGREMAVMKASPPILTSNSRGKRLKQFM
jgi:hypothetical protein